MNKMLIFPLAILFLLTVYSWVGGGESSSGLVPLYGDGTIYLTNDTLNQSGSFYVADDTEFDMWSAVSVLAILIGAVILGSVITLNVLGTGLQDFSGNVVFQAFVYMGLWAALTYASIDYLVYNSFGLMFWVALTVFFLIGFSQQVSIGGADG